VIDLFCPKCGAEYREGFTRCADCGTTLVWEKPAEVEDDGADYVEYTEVLRTFSLADVAIIRSLLEDAGIDYYIKDEHFALVRPLVEPPTVMVNKDQVQEAREILKDLKIEFRGITGLGRTPDGNEDVEE
jgi:hypothetical protein